MKYSIPLTCIALIMSGNYSCKPEVAADLIFFNGKIVTADNNFTIAEAVAISGDTILAVGSNSKIKSYKGEITKAIDLQGKTVIPGIIDSHLHPESAAVSELEEEIPDARSIVQLLAWIRSQSLIKEKGSWIIFPKFFPTRLVEMRQPTLNELDSAAPDDPVHS